MWTWAHNDAVRIREWKGADVCLPKAHPVHVIFGGGDLSVLGSPLTSSDKANFWMRRG